MEADAEARTDECLKGFSDRIDQQLRLLQECLARIGETGAASLAQRDERMYAMLEECASYLGDGGGEEKQTASRWKPKLRGAGMELRSPRVWHRSTSMQVPQRPRSNSIHSNLSPGSVFSDLAVEPPRPQLATAVARSPSGSDLRAITPGSSQVRALQWRAEISAIAAANAGLAHGRGVLLTVNEQQVPDALQAGNSVDSHVVAARRRTGACDEASWSFRRRMWQFLEDKQSGRAALVYSYLRIFAILACVFVSVMDVHSVAGTIPIKLMFFIETPFVLELIVRFSVCPNRNLFWLDPYNHIDLLAISAGVLPELMYFFGVAERVVRGFQVFTPCVFLLRFLRRFEHLQLLASAFAAAARALPVLLYTCFLIALFYASALYLVETRAVFPTMRDSLWFTIVTMSTVGYGDVTPVTDAGRTLASSLIILASLYTAIPIGIVGHVFSRVWEDRDRLLLMQQLRQRISRGGYTPKDLANMFYDLDEDRNGTLSFEEFKELLPMMRISNPDAVAFSVFQTFDDDGDGELDFEEFLMGIFPAQGFLLSTLRKSTSNL